MAHDFVIIGCFDRCCLICHNEGLFFYLKDKKTQQKYAGVITVIKKSTKKGDRVIFTDDPQIRKLNLTEQAQFNKVVIGDELTIEISRFTKTIFRLEKGPIDLLNNN